MCRHPGLFWETRVSRLGPRLRPIRLTAQYSASVRASVGRHPPQMRTGKDTTSDSIRYQKVFSFKSLNSPRRDTCQLTFCHKRTDASMLSLFDKSDAGMWLYSSSIVVYIRNARKRIRRWKNDKFRPRKLFNVEYHSSGEQHFLCHPKDYCGRFTSYIFRCIRLLLQERKGWQIVSQGLFQKVNHDGDRNVLCQKITRNEGDRWQTKLSENRIDDGMIRNKVLTKLIVPRQTTQEEKYWIQDINY